MRLSYEWAYIPPKVDPLLAEANANQKEEHARQEGALVFYNKRRDEDILCQFVNGLGRELREVLIRQDDLLKKTVKTVLTQISTLEEEQEVTKRVSAAQRTEISSNLIDDVVNPNMEDMRPSLKSKLDEILKNQRTMQAAAVKKGGKRFAGRQRPSPKPSDICRACNGQGHWARSCPSLNERGVGRRSPVQPRRITKGSGIRIGVLCRKLRSTLYR